MFASCIKYVCIYVSLSSSSRFLWRFWSPRFLLANSLFNNNNNITLCLHLVFNIFVLTSVSRRALDFSGASFWRAILLRVAYKYVFVFFLIKYRLIWIFLKLLRLQFFSLLLSFCRPFSSFLLPRCLPFVFQINSSKLSPLLLFQINYSKLF